MTKEDELLIQARRLADGAASWADLSNDLFAPGTGLLAVAFPDPADRRAFRDTPQYREVVGLVSAAIDRFGLVAGATPRRTGRGV